MSKQHTNQDVERFKPSKSPNYNPAIFYVGAILVFVFFVVLISEVGNSSSTPTEPLSKNQSIEIAYETSHLSDSLDLLKTVKHIYVKGKMVKENIMFDTLPALGDTLIVGEDDDGNTKKFPKKKDYQIFVTIK